MPFAVGVYAWNMQTFSVPFQPRCKEPGCEERARIIKSVPAGESVFAKCPEGHEHEYLGSEIRSRDYRIDSREGMTKAIPVDRS